MNASIHSLILRSPIRAIVLALVLALVTWANPAHARKVALIIGNSVYAKTTSLTNPPNDTRIIAEAARSAGFNVVLANDLDNVSFQRALRDFRASADGADIAMIYYAGHAIEGQGKNWLIPTDAELKTEFDLPYETINLDRLLESVTGAQVRMLVLDSCRNNPFGNSWRRGVRAVPTGMAGFEVDDVLILYAAAPGQVAMDGTGDNSPFALSLAERLAEPGLPIQLLGGAVRDDVLRATGGKQRPFVSASITGTPVYLIEPEPVIVAGEADRTTLEALAWQGAASSDALVAYQAFLQQFPNGIFAKLARNRIANLTSGAGAAPPETPAQLTRTAAPTEGTIKTLSPAPAPAPIASPPAQPLANPAAAQPDSAALAAANPGPAPAQGAVTGAAPLKFTAVRLMSEEPPTDLAPLPMMPATPKFSDADFPSCKDDYLSLATSLEKVEAINRCTSALDRYYAGPMLAFRQKMIAHQNEVTDLFAREVSDSRQYRFESKQAFFARVLEEHAASENGGPHLADYRAAQKRYKLERAFLQERYCEFAGCANGTETAAPAD